MTASTEPRTAAQRPAVTATAVPASVPRRGLRAWATKGHLVAAGLITLAFVSPIYLTLVNAFKSQDQIISNPAAPPAPPTLRNLTDALSRPDRIIEIGLSNSALTVVASVLLIIPLGSAFSFWLSRRSARFRGIVLGGFAAGLMIPPAVVLLPTIRILTFLHLDHTYPGLILANVGGGYLSFAVFVYSGFLRSIPAEIIEAATVDGAGSLRIWWKIVMPLLRPATATVAIFLSLWIWNDFMNPQFILGPLKGQTITTGIYLSVGQYSTNYAQLFGVMLLAAVIPVAGYLALQKQFIAGLTSGASK
ncbi:carbohydrate ABC transporter permease [Streptacidiphilus jiangxiensis]|uniref:Multiple sugar transport system permease protein/raffinose/stachyose/melibiose transport system permease protein n=1 Tax=Streptacidiphilus jiangxiensis TaxID=235985 RepID=A0A1H7WDR3_STRJI|nr:carbohydrate ABC transporter permease [Streptacidiphilus jiangxiensis]SEM19484.1 multiple sugar transport system permease protein/raffinose/stachyose/melibiose transport system permease protein [Streptacidiphilus jiangxiensis]